MKSSTVVTAASFVAVIASLFAFTFQMGERTAPQSREQQNSRSIRQGERMTVGQDYGDRAVCTVGYVLTRERVAVTSGHCDVGLGQVFNQAGELVGDLSASRERDVATVALRDDVHLGVNMFADPGEDSFTRPDVGDRVCTFGVKTGGPRCGSVVRFAGDEMYTDDGLAGDVGDSGGPVWRERDGAPVGVYRGVARTRQDGVPEVVEGVVVGLY